MKKILILLIALLIFSPVTKAEDDLIDLNMAEIDDAFNSSNRKYVSDQEFNRAINQVQQKRKGLIQKIKEKFTGKKIEDDEKFKNATPQGVGEMGKSAKDIINEKPYLLLPVALKDSFGKTIPQGHYQIEYKKVDNTINFMQGNRNFGTLKTVQTVDNWNSNAIIYARIIYPKENVAKVIFSNLDTCREGYAQIINLGQYLSF